MSPDCMKPASKHAHCPVAIVRFGGAPQTDSGWIAAVQNDEPDNEAVVHRAMEEGRLPRAPGLLIDRRLDNWGRRYPDVHVRTVSARPRRTRSLENHGNSIQFAGPCNAASANDSPVGLAG